VRFVIGDVCVVEVSVEGAPWVRGEGSDLFEAFAAVRRVLEAEEVLLVCNGCRRDVYPSPMLRQASAGRHAYVLHLPRSTAQPPTVDIFGAAPEPAILATVDEQREWFDRWRKSNMGP
jgi:hypothetical protein